MVVANLLVIGPTLWSWSPLADTHSLDMHTNAKVFHCDLASVACRPSADSKRMHGGGTHLGGILRTPGGRRKRPGIRSAAPAGWSPGGGGANTGAAAAAATRQSSRCTAAAADSTCVGNDSESPQILTTRTLKTLNPQELAIRS